MSEPELSQDEIQRIRNQLLTELKEELWHWGRTRFWIVVVLVGAVTFFGVRSVVRDVLVDDIKKVRDKVVDVLSDTKAETKAASEAAKRASDAAIEIAEKIKAAEMSAALSQKAAEKARHDIEKAKEEINTSLKDLSNTVEVRLAEFRGSAFSENETSGTIRAFIRPPDGSPTNPVNRANLRKVRDWIDQSPVEGLPIANFLANPELREMRLRAIQEIPIP